jgi:hypothetical protein
MMGIEIEWGEALRVMVKITALSVLWQCGRGIKKVCGEGTSSDLSQLVDCLEKLKAMSAESPSGGATARRPAA